jgi:hypothetical protein
MPLRFRQPKEWRTIFIGGWLASVEVFGAARPFPAKLGVQ